MQKWLALLLVLLWCAVARAQFDGGEFDNDDFDDEDFDQEGPEGEYAGGQGGQEEDAVEPVNELPPVPYVKPSGLGLTFLETFDDGFSRWVQSTSQEVSGTWKITTREKEAITGDMGLRVEKEATLNAISAKVPAINRKSEWAFSYEAKFEHDLKCGGAYVKFFDSANLDSLEDFDKNTPYIVMFGPDRCGTTNKIHFIVKHQNPISKEWEEKHMKQLVRLPIGTFPEEAHVYTLHVKDNNFDILVDGKSVAKGSFDTDFEPPFTNSLTIADPTDTQPEDWVTQEKIADPEAKKPDDWDEDAPQFIDDPNDVMPEDWLVDEPKFIADMNANQPDDWDEDEDDEWERPLIANPKCKDVSGCGTYSPKRIRNTEYKGKWQAPMIVNPEYKGAWKARQIPNEFYYEEKNPGLLAKFDAMGFDLWTMQDHLIFDNVAFANTLEPIETLISETWGIRNPIEVTFVGAIQKAAMKSPETGVSTPDKIKGVVNDLQKSYGSPFVGAVGCVIVLSCMLLLSCMKRMCTRKSSPAPATTTATPASPSKEDENKEVQEIQAKPKEKEARKRAGGATKPSTAD